MFERACQDLDLKLASKHDPTLGGASFARYSQALKRMHELEEALQNKESELETFSELLSYVLVTVPNPLDNVVVQGVINNKANIEKERDSLAS